MIKKEDILKMVAQYITEQHANKKWVAGKDWVQYAGPYFDSEEFVAATDTLLKEWLVLGHDALEFERQFPPLLGKEFGIVTNSGSSANLIMLLTAKKYYNLPKGTKVITPVAGFPTTVNPIIQAGFIPVFVDIESDTLNLNLSQVENALINSGAKILMFAPVLGNPPNMWIIEQFKRKYGLIILEDCCDSLGSTFVDRLLGSYADMSSCSFYPAHHITMGEGGFVACPNKEQERIARSFREWGRGCYCTGKTAGLSNKGTCGCRFNNWLPQFPDEIFDHKYIYDNLGYNLKPIELQCSIGLTQLKKLPEIHKIRKENYKSLKRIFDQYDEYFYCHESVDGADPSWFAFPLSVKSNSPFKRSRFTQYMEEQKIQTRNYFGGNLLLQPAYAGIEWMDMKGNLQTCPSNSDWPKFSFPISTQITTNTLFLGCSPVVTQEQIEYIGLKTSEFIKNL